MARRVSGDTCRRIEEGRRTHAVSETGGRPTIAAGERYYRARPCSVQRPSEHHADEIIARVSNVHCVISVYRKSLWAIKKRCAATSIGVSSGRTTGATPACQNPSLAAEKR